MARQLKPRRYEVRLTDHGWERFQERGGPYVESIGRNKLHKIIHNKFNGAIGPGVLMDMDAAQVEVLPFLNAILAIQDNGWVVVTFKYVDREEVG